MKHWVSAWGYRITDFSLFPLEIENETQRVIFRHNVDACGIRVEFSNRYGRYSLPISHAAVALADSAGNIFPDTIRDVLFNGKREYVLAPEETIYCDPIELRVSPDNLIAVSLYIEPRTLITGACSQQSRVITKYVKNNKAGDLCGKTNFEAYDQHAYFTGFLSAKPLYTCFYGIDEVELLTEDDIKTIVVFGDSLTQQGHWSEAFSERLYNTYPGQFTVVNRGICGNRLLRDASSRGYFGNYFGEAAILRFEEDVFTNHDVKVDYVIARAGINDLIQPRVLTTSLEAATAEELQDGLNILADISHKHGTKVYTSTSTPYNGYMGTAAWFPEDEIIREEVDDWIRSGRSRFDGYFEFASAVADPEDKTRIMDGLHLGDALHPNAEGGRLMAENIPLDSFFA